MEACAKMKKYPALLIFVAFWSMAPCSSACRTPVYERQVAYFPGTQQLFEVYEGELLDGVRHGNGRYIRYKENGAILEEYSGRWENGKRRGTGQAVQHDLLNDSFKALYSGEWNDDCYSGEGILEIFFADGERSVYNGEFKNCLKDGNGVLRNYKSGRLNTEYDGDFSAGRMHGQGTFTQYRNGNLSTRYTGQFKDDSQTGYGVETYFDGRQPCEGRWKDGVYLGP
jgi:hypothetical protein